MSWQAGVPIVVMSQNPTGSFYRSSPDACQMDTKTITSSSATSGTGWAVSNSAGSTSRTTMNRSATSALARKARPRNRSRSRELIARGAVGHEVRPVRWRHPVRAWPERHRPTRIVIEVLGAPDRRTSPTPHPTRLGLLGRPSSTDFCGRGGSDGTMSACGTEPARRGRTGWSS